MADGLLSGGGRRAALDDIGAGLIRYIPPEWRALAGLIAEANPVRGIERAGQAARRLAAPEAAPMERVAATGNVLSEMAGVLAPAAVAGRAGMPAVQAVQEGTDETLDMGDPVLNTRLNEYLYFNYDLPMDEASRMARAAKMGFDVGKTRYHGSEADFNAANPDISTGERYKTGIFTSTNPDVADSYVSTQGGIIYPMLMRRNDAGAIIDAQGANWNRISRNSPAFLPSSALADEFPELAGGKFNTAYDVAPNLFDDLFGEGASTNALARQRRFEGDSNITFENVVDRGPALKRYLGETEEMAKAREASASMPSEVRVDFYGNQIRSPFARFDPRLRHLRNLSAGVGGLGLLAYGEEEQ